MSIKVLSSEKVLETRVFDLMKDQIELPSGKSTSRFTIVHPGAAVFIPRLGPDRFLVIRQYRHALRREILEFPAGTLEKGEEPLDCAKREICEEVGYAASKWTALGYVWTFPGFGNEILHAFLADDLSPNKAAADDDEMIEVVEMRKVQIEQAIVKNDLADAKSISAWCRAGLLGLL